MDPGLNLRWDIGVFAGHFAAIVHQDLKNVKHIKRGDTGQSHLAGFVAAFPGNDSKQGQSGAGVPFRC